MMKTAIKLLLKGSILLLALLAIPVLCPAEDLAPEKNYQTVLDLTDQILSSGKVNATSKAKVKAASTELKRQFMLFYGPANGDYVRLQQGNPNEKEDIAPRLKKEQDDLTDFDSSYQVQNYISLCKAILRGHFKKKPHLPKVGCHRPGRNWEALRMSATGTRIGLEWFGIAGVKAN
ncbi:MAG TPA: hypothetical protein VGR89_03700 [Puia sp.]|nr:hypothetical protein [Puia sp.]